LHSTAEWLLLQRAVLAVSEWHLVHDGAADYVALGYDSGNGRPTRYKLLEFLTIAGLYNEAEAEKWRQSETSIS
jgi:hypothetical protein